MPPEFTDDLDQAEQLLNRAREERKANGASALTLLAEAQTHVLIDIARTLRIIGGGQLPKDQ